MVSTNATAPNIVGQMHARRHGGGRNIVTFASCPCSDKVEGRHDERRTKTFCWHQAEPVSLASLSASAVSISIAAAVVVGDAKRRGPRRPRGVRVGSRQFRHL